MQHLVNNLVDVLEEFNQEFPASEQISEKDRKEFAAQLEPICMELAKKYRFSW